MRLRSNIEHFVWVLFFAFCELKMLAQQCRKINATLQVQEDFQAEITKQIQDFLTKHIKYQC